MLVKRDAAASSPFDHLTPELLPPWVAHTPRPKSTTPPNEPQKAPARAAPDKSMHIEVVDRFETFAGLREDWDAVYAADPEAHFFISWIWFEKWLRRCDDDWIILVAKQGADAPHPVAFFPLRVVDKKWKDSWFYNEIRSASGFADYAGILCRPELEAQALTAFREHFGRLTWARIDIDCIRISDRRLSLLLQPSDGAETKVVDSNVQDGIDLFRCPYVDLPADWETYLADSLSANNRQKARRFLKRVEQDDAFRITHAGADTIERDLEILLQLWAARWGAQKGDRLPGILKTNRLMLAGCFERDALFLPVLWKDGKPLAALAILKDAQKKTMLFFIGGRDQDFKEVPPAFVLHAHSIRHAIAEGFKTYDFLLGDEPYKYAFATDEYRLKGVLVTTKDRRNLGGKLLPRSLPYVFKHSFELHQKRKLDEAAMGYRQMLEVDPRSGEALFGLGQILAARGDHGAAIDTFKTYVAIGAPPPNLVVVDGAAMRRGLEASSRGESAVAFELLRPFADAGDARTQAVVARLLFHGDGVTKDRAAAARYATRAAQAGNAEAQQYLARLYFLGDGGLAKDLSQAFEWARKSAEAGNRDGQALFGKFHWEGAGVAKDAAKAAHWWQKSAAQNYAQAILRLGWLYELGEGVTTDAATAYTLYRRAEILGSCKAKEAADRLAQSLKAGTRKAAEDRAKQGWLPPMPVET